MPALEPREQVQPLLEAPPIQKALPATASENAGSPAEGHGGTIRKLGLALILLAAAAFAYWKIKGNQQEAVDTSNKAAMAANRAIPVTSATVVARTMPIYLNALGTVTAYNTVTIKSRVDGQLLTVAVREGQKVSKGQVLATIDPRPYAAVVAQAEGQLTKDEAAAANATAEAARYTALLSAGVISKESQQTQIANAGQSAGALDSDRAMIQAAKVNVSYTRITSPIDGVVGLRQVDAGNIVHASDPNGLLVVTQLQPIGVIFTLPEDQLPRVLQLIRSGSKLVVEAYDRSETLKLGTGSLLTLDNEIDTTTGTVKAKAVFDNKDGALFPNQFVNVRLILEQRQNALVIPASALQTGSSGTYVYQIKPCPETGCPEDPGSNPDGSAAAPGSTGKGKAAGSGVDPAADPAAARGPKYFVQAAPVVVDLTEGSNIILTGGVRPGDQVVVDGQEKLKPLSRVEPRSSDGSGGRRGGSQGAAANPAANPAASPTDGAAAVDTGQGGLDEPAAGGRNGHAGAGHPGTGRKRKEGPTP